MITVWLLVIIEFGRGGFATTIPVHYSSYQECKDAFAESSRLNAKEASLKGWNADDLSYRCVPAKINKE